MTARWRFLDASALTVPSSCKMREKNHAAAAGEAAPPRDLLEQAEELAADSEVDVMERMGDGAAIVESGLPLGESSGFVSPRDARAALAVLSPRAEEARVKDAEGERAPSDTA